MNIKEEELKQATNRRNYRPWYLRRLVVDVIRKACHGLSNFALVVMRQAGAGAGAGAGADNEDDDESDARRPKALHAERSSPVSIDHAFRKPAGTQLLAALPMCTFSLTFVYTDLVCRSLWNTLFHSGGGSGMDGDPATVRALASHHLTHPSVDGWNVVAGAIELAQAWAVPESEKPRRSDDWHGFALETRLRLAVCLSVAWKFERSTSTHFPRWFYAPEPTLFAPHTHELAYVGYSFLTLEEQTKFGRWHRDNAVKIRKLYNKMVALEVELLLSANVMTLLTRNAQVLAEDRIAALFAQNIVSADAAMAMRAVAPLFRIASQDGNSAPPSPGALACAAMLCMSVPTAVRPYVLHCHKTVRAQFTIDERRGARALLDQATHLRGVAAATVEATCYSDDKWVHYPFVCTDALRIALFMAHDLCV